MDENALRSRREHLIDHDRLLSDLEADELQLAYQKTCVPDAVKVERDALVQFLPAGRISKIFAIATAQLGLEIDAHEGQAFDENMFASLTKRLRSLIDVQFAALLKPDADPIVNKPQFRVPRFLFNAAFKLCDYESVGRTLTSAISSCTDHQERQALLVSVAKNFPGDEILTERVLDIVCSNAIPAEDRLDICEQLCSAQDYGQHLYAKALIYRRDAVLPEVYFGAEIIRYLDLIAEHFELDQIGLIPELQTIANNILAEDPDLIDDFGEDVLNRFHLSDLEGWTDSASLLCVEAIIEDRFRCLLEGSKTDLYRLPEVPTNFDR